MLPSFPPEPSRFAEMLRLVLGGHRLRGVVVTAVTVFAIPLVVALSTAPPGGALKNAGITLAVTLGCISAGANVLGVIAFRDWFYRTERRKRDLRNIIDGMKDDVAVAKAEMMRQGDARVEMARANHRADVHSHRGAYGRLLGQLAGKDAEIRELKAQIDVVRYERDDMRELYGKALHQLAEMNR